MIPTPHPVLQVLHEVYDQARANPSVPVHSCDLSGELGLDAEQVAVCIGLLIRLQYISGDGRGEAILLTGAGMDFVEGRTISATSPG
ncbi:MAG: hypothetical protein WD737_01765 [Gemmatimonadota bacterium]